MKVYHLYLLHPQVTEGGELGYCRACAEMLGLLQLYPALKQLVKLHFIDPQRPRRELIDLLGADNQNCPVLVLDACPADLPPRIGISQGKGRLFVEGVPQIARYLASVHPEALRKVA